MNLFRKFLWNRYEHSNIQLFDIISIGYILLIGLLLIPFHNHVSNWKWLVLAHITTVIFILELLRFAKLHPSPMVNFLRTFYPAIGIYFAWVELGQIVNMIFPFWADNWILHLDVTIFKTHPTVWVQQFFTPWLTELMNFFYTSYYLMIPFIGFILYFSKSRQAAFNYFSYLMLVSIICYVLFIIFPCKGAWMLLQQLHTKQLTGGFFLKLIQHLQANNANIGCAFPSAHVATAFTMGYVALKYIRPLGYLVMLNAIGVAMSAVYLRYHHAVDAIGGILVATICYFVSTYLIENWENIKTKYFKYVKQKKEPLKIVSV